MMNLLKETIETLENNRGLSLSDIKVVMLKGRLVCLSEFIALADVTDYDSGYGTNEIHHSLIVAGEDWWLTREEYDGSESWRFNTMPIVGLPRIEKLTSLKEDNSWKT